MFSGSLVLLVIFQDRVGVTVMLVLLMVALVIILMILLLLRLRSMRLLLQSMWVHMFSVSLIRLAVFMDLMNVMVMMMTTTATGTSRPLNATTNNGPNTKNLNSFVVYDLVVVPMILTTATTAHTTTKSTSINSFIYNSYKRSTSNNFICVFEHCIFHILLLTQPTYFCISLHNNQFSYVVAI